MAAEGEICSVDLALIADKTGSVGKDNFKVMKGFLVEITNSLDISPGTTHEAVITYANVSKVLNTLGDSKYHSNKAMHMLIARIDNELSSPTRTDRALEAANDQLFSKKGGDRPDFPNSLILFTDGKTNPASKPYSQIIPLLKVRIGSPVARTAPNLTKGAKPSVVLNASCAFWVRMVSFHQ